MEEYLRNIRNEEQSKNVNEIKVSGWYPSNLITPVRVNANIFNNNSKKTQDEDIEQYIKSKNDKIAQLKIQNKIIESNPVNSLSAQQDDFSYINRLFPLYKYHINFK